MSEGHALATWDHTSSLQSTLSLLVDLVSKLGSKAKVSGKPASYFHPLRKSKGGGDISLPVNDSNTKLLKVAIDRLGGQTPEV